jgi:lipopolysaccharide assembly outer membrane protein LptD (OstA)
MRSSRRRRAGVAAALLVAAVALLAAAPWPAAAQPADTTALRPGEEPYRLRADRLEGSATGDENVYTAIRATVQHGSTTVTGDTALVYRSRELVLFRGNVKIVDGSTVMRGDEASYDRRRRTATLRGNVRIQDGASRIVGREARFYRDENRSEILGSPMMEDSVRTLKADRIEYDRTNDVVTAIGHVDAFDRAESTRIQAGRVRFDRRRDYAWAEDDPRLTVDEAGGRNTFIRGRRFEVDNRRRQFYAIDSVRVEREKLRAEGDRAEFYQSEERALLLGKPRAWDDQGRVQGDTLELRFAGNRVRSVQVRPNAEVEYESRGDSLGRGERNFATGDTVTLHLEEDEARRAWIVGRARSRYWPAAAESAKGGRNVSTGDSILVEFEGGRPRRATVYGGSQGTYHLAAEGDTSRPARQEQVQYSGDRIVYDLEGGVVDVLQHAEVRYKEMRLTSEQIRFDSRTQQMRAEGKPVLQDGRDRITGVTMTYDLERRQGIVYDGRTTYERGFYYGEQVRRVSDNELAVRHGVYSTCELETPHYHFSSAKMKLYVHDKVVARPVIFYLKKIPVLAFPFYVFPIKPGRHSGFALPQVEFGGSTAKGKFIRNLGYYWAISEYMDGTAWADYYVEDRFVLHGQVRYNKRYRFQGQLNGSFERQQESGSTRWDLAGTHYQNLGPRFSFTAGGTLTNSSSYLSDPFLGRSVVLRVQRNLRSSISLQKGWSGASFSAGLVRDQDLDPDPGGTRIAEQLPSVLFTVTARPIGRPARGRDPARLPALVTTVWSLRSNLQSQRQTIMRSQPDTTWDCVVDSTGEEVCVVRSITLNDSTTLVGTATRTDLSLSDTRSLLGIFRVSPSMSYSEVFYSKDAAGNLNQRAGVWGAALGANLSAFGTFRPGIGPLRAIRHVLTPSAYFRYQPPYPKLFYTDTAGVSRPRFTGIGGISLTAGEVQRIDFSIRNDLHVKWGDAAKPTVINNMIEMQTGFSYDLLAVRNAERAERQTGVKHKAQPLSALSTRLILRPIRRSDFTFDFVHNPYDGKLLRLNASTGFALSGRTTEDRYMGSQPQPAPGTDALASQSGMYTPQGTAPTALPWQFSLAVSYSGFADPIQGATYRPWEAQTRSNGMFGFNPSRHWRFDYSWQYDLLGNRMISQNYTVKRDLHCWEMQFTRSLSGGESEYYFKINVKNLPEVYFEQGSRGLRGFGGIPTLF